MGFQGRSGKAWLAGGVGLTALAMAGAAWAEEPAPAEVEAVVVTARPKPHPLFDVVPGDVEPWEVR